MGVYVIKMPDIGEGIAEVELVEWHVKEGDDVVEDQVLADVMTDKATVQVPSPVHGKVLALGGEVGEVMPVGSALSKLEVEGPGNVSGADEDGEAAARASAGSAAHAAHAAPAAASMPAQQHDTPSTNLEETESVQQVEPAALQQGAAQQRAAASDSVRSQAATAVAGGMKAAAAAAVSALPSAVPQHAARRGRPLASPAVRRRALEEGIDLRAVQGTGPVGQITHEDLDRWQQQGSAIPAVGFTGATAYAAFARREGAEEIPVVGLRRKIAQEMQQSKRHIPHVTDVA